MTSLSPRLLSYCTNAYTGNSWDSILASIARFSANVCKSSALQRPIGLGLWIPAQAAEYAIRTERVRELVSLCQETKTSIHALNGFPHGEFHAPIVKQKVFSPDWTTHARVQYTRNLMNIATQTLESQSELGISTVPISWGEWINTKEELEIAALHLVSLASDAYFAEKANGVFLHIALEPEPFGYLSKSTDVVQFFKKMLLPLGTRELQQRWGVSSTVAEEILLDKIRICYDTCHAAVEFEKPREIVARYRAIGIQLGRIQISSAPILHLRKGRCLDGTLPSTTLAPFQKDTYLHQVIGFDLDRRPYRFPDLPEALKKLETDLVSGEFRIHMHLPIFLERFGPLYSTQNHIAELIGLDQESPVCRNWEIETYTWNILPKTFQTEPLETYFVQEANWVDSLFKKTKKKGNSPSASTPHSSTSRVGTCL